MHSNSIDWLVEEAQVLRATSDFVIGLSAELQEMNQELRAASAALRERSRRLREASENVREQYAIISNGPTQMDGQLAVAVPEERRKAA